jgi:hypothetical protein
LQPTTIISGAEPVYRERFTSETLGLTRALLASLCELTLANELEIVLQSDETREQFRAFYVRLFTSFRTLVSPRAFQAYVTTFEADA